MIAQFERLQASEPGFDFIIHCVHRFLGGLDIDSFLQFRYRIRVTVKHADDFGELRAVVQAVEQDNGKNIWFDGSRKVTNSYGVKARSIVLIAK